MKQTDWLHETRKMGFEEAYKSYKGGLRCQISLGTQLANAEPGSIPKRAIEPEFAILYQQ